MLLKLVSDRNDLSLATVSVKALCQEEQPHATEGDCL
jgi:hypothetical protein